MRKYGIATSFLKEEKLLFGFVGLSQSFLTCVKEKIKLCLCLSNHHGMNVEGVEA
jgi:hypothetical protein